MKGSGLRKISKKKVGTGIIIVIVLAGAGIGFLLLRGRRAAAMQLTVTAQEATARKGSISNTVVGTGNLEEDTGDTQKVPSGLEYDEILVEAGDEVNKGDTLAVINKKSLLNLIVETQEKLESLEDEIEEAEDEEQGSYEYQALVAEKEEDEAFLDELEALTESYVIAAQQAGTVMSVSISSKDDVSSEDGSGSAGSTAGNSNTSGSVSTAAVRTGMISGSFLYLNSTAEEETQGSAPELSVNDITASADMPVSEAKGDADGEDGDVQDAQVITDCRDLTLQIPRTGDSMEKSIDMAGYAGTVNWSEADECYTATVNLTAKAGYCFASDIQPVINGGTVSGCSVTGNGEGNRLAFTLTVEKPDSVGAEGGQPAENKTESGETSATGTDNGGSDSGTDNTAGSGNQNKTADSSTEGSIYGQEAGSVSGGVTSGSAVTGNTDSTSAAESGSAAGSIDANHIQAFSIAAGDKMLLSVNVDELDILSVDAGQEAAVTFDALEGETYTGTITEISDSASVSGGVAKYAVEIELAKDENMRAGMNASATITIESKEDIITIPLNALQEQGGKTFVYTQKDDESGQLGGETQVETGLSDSENVEITSGLSDGDIVYYNRTGTSESDDSDMMPGGGMMFDGGAVPDGGGEMPSGGSGGGPGGGAPGM
ncbi:HlyD family efflux transporter periplasmic adaptor subunit [Ruminococcus sp. OA3]|uniref:HlyD family efflux transporter periplasmic adaptor subunit n=1 Tax=Ruminococcus sp. OA3 TaxID=2914164 RepID=UPI001F0599CA|nr:HlyD family efflux transporter periplasmic adaptor subunit [Ruminococcus sp. OA3]MCH1981086.1 HlyD family efflux transporter periplasmic adaptor subunit [Ruminococcus sp. OA3]